MKKNELEEIAKKSGAPFIDENSFDLQIRMMLEEYQAMRPYGNLYYTNSPSLLFDRIKNFWEGKIYDDDDLNSFNYVLVDNNGEYKQIYFKKAGMVFKEIESTTKLEEPVIHIVNGFNRLAYRDKRIWIDKIGFQIIDMNDEKWSSDNSINSRSNHCFIYL